MCCILVTHRKQTAFQGIEPYLLAARERAEASVSLHLRARFIACMGFERFDLAELSGSAAPK